MATKKQVDRENEKDLARLSAVQTELMSLKAKRQAEIEEINSKYGPMVDPLETESSKLVDKITARTRSNRKVLFPDDSKTLSYRSGTLSIKSSPGSLIVEDEGVVVRYLRRMGKLRAFTTIGKRSINKRALKADPEFVSKAPGMYIDQPESLSVKLRHPQAEIVQVIEPFKRKV